MMNNYKNFTPSMKVLFWLAWGLILINIVCLVLAVFRNIVPGVNFIIGAFISLPLTFIILLILAAKTWEMNKRDK